MARARASVASTIGGSVGARLTPLPSTSGTSVQAATITSAPALVSESANDDIAACTSGPVSPALTR